MFRKLFAWFRGLFFFLWLLFVCLLGGWLAWANSDTISVNLFSFQLPELTVGAYLCMTFVVGFSLGWFGTWLLARIKLFARKRELVKTRKEVEKLRTAHLQQ